MTKSTSSGHPAGEYSGCRFLFTPLQSKFHRDHPLSVTLNYIELKYPISFVLGRFLETENFYMIKFTVNLYVEVCGKKFVPEKHQKMVDF